MLVKFLNKRFVILALLAMTFYLGIFLILYYQNLIGLSYISDEARYISFAQNLLDGFYSPPFPNINLWNGPGYPLFLAPFIWAGLNRIDLVLINVIISILTVLLIYKIAHNLLSSNKAFAVSLIWLFYYLHYPEVFTVLTEPLATFLFLATFWALLKHHQTFAFRYLLLGAFCFAFLILTKVIFIYALVFFLAYIIFKNIFSHKVHFRHLIFIGLSFLFTIPYQVYTYNITGKLFYFSNAGGSSLYWMSNPNKYEYGEWHNSNFTTNCGNKDIPCNANLIARNHKHVLEKLEQLDGLAQDAELKRIAYYNIINNPLKYLQNIASNFSRMLFNFPDSYYYQSPKTLFRILPNSILISTSMLAIFLIFRLKSIRALYLNQLMPLVAGYLAICLLLSAYPRMLHIVMPVIFIWIFFILSKSYDELIDRKSNI
jgi:4-amino-4-deoxy-L-arabinose transferase-like glycosyltransferase